MASSESGIVYIGDFVHCISLTDLCILENHAVGVDGNGVIRLVELADKTLDGKIKSQGWETWNTVKAPEGRVAFWAPGFIGMW